MTPNVFEDLPSGGVFRDETALQPEFLPDVLPGREKQIQNLAQTLLPFAQGRKASSILVYGPPGTGKTSSAKMVLSQLRDYAQSVQTVYVNAWHHYTQASVFAETARLMGIPVPRRGLAIDEVRTDLFNRLAKVDARLVLVLDEADRLFHKREESVLYDLSRAPVPIVILAITNTPEIFEHLDPRVKSSLSLQSIEFPRYSPLELKDILRARIEKAFRKGACGEEVIGLCAAYASKQSGGDARVALDVLWKAGRQAERRGTRVVEEVDVRAAFAEQDQLNASVKKRMAGIGDVEQKILAALTAGPKYSGGLVKELDVPERTLRRHLEQLSNKRLITIEEEINVDGAGKRRLVRKV